ncbi:ATP-binding protein [Anaeromyxobacter sp. Fw109-5]|uniref:ATP-binding protein n=1 Tax=Anaeromyxobacter sp. (strain Fw109-5) TaxID=404589 RepID=UPI0000ED7497|nr:ATP-binding protein [Anaeromyxobacter sp. Fw109-5]ABS26864.1 multi-sensor signal transduction histidine kinase [Anaeromyxobacter sp. Fw109-5]
MADWSPSVALQFKPVLDAAPDAMVITDRVGRMVVVNSEAERLFGYGSGELLGSPVETLIPERFRTAHPHHRNRYFLDPRTRPMGGAGGVELFGLRKDGTEFPAEISLSPLETEDGMFAITAIRDVTVRRKLESHTKALLEAAPDAMVIADRRGKVLLVNAQAERLFGYTREELLGQRVEALIPPRFRAAHPAHRTRYFDEPRPRPMGAGGLELYGLRKDGTEFPAEISLSPLETADGLLAITAIRDVAERKRAEEDRARLHAQLQATLEELGAAYDKSQQLERLKTQFFANVSHELRTPLALILGPADELLASDLPPGPRRDVEVIARNARTLAKHVNDLLDVAKLEAGKMALELSDVDVAQLVRLVAAHFDALAASREMAYSVEAPATLAARVDPDKLQRVVFNLLSNAFKFTPEAGKVRCTLRVEPEGAGSAPDLAIEVADSGPGVPPAERETVFARFTRGDDDTARRVGGTGLGLAITRDFVELHGGRIALGEAPEGGAIFSVHLPLRAAAGAPAGQGTGEGASEYGAGVVEELRSRATKPAATGERGRPLVLVVEDNPDMRRFVGDALSGEFEVATAPDGEAGLAAALARPPDAVVTDMMMPRMSGEELVRAARRHDALAGVPVLVLTARADDALRAQLLRDGAQDYLMKPFSPEELRARTANLVSVKLAREVLQRELRTQTSDVVALAGEVAARKRELEAALEVTRLAKEEAERASAVKTNFLRLVSHELRTPLTTLHLQLQRLTRDTEHPLEPHQREIVRRGSFAATRLTGLVEALLHEAQLASGRLSVAVEDVDLGALVAKVVEEHRPLADDKGLALRLRARDHVPWVETEPRFLKLILSNLVGNAVKFTAAGVVEVGVEGRGDELRVEVRDSGPGIAAEDRARVFEPFERGVRVAEQFVPGLGLGLAVVRDLAAAIGATVELSSSSSAGSTFTVTLPRRQPSAARGVSSRRGGRREGEKGGTSSATEEKSS